MTDTHDPDGWERLGGLPQVGPEDDDPLIDI
jgi:hypothetical protein